MHAALRQNGVFQDIGKIAGVESVSVIHALALS
jgi:hypothetical protein